MRKMIIPRSFGTHDGTFHADEVTACALLLIFDKIDRDKIVRTRETVDLEKCEYVCDVGGIYDLDIKRFDHHQVDYQGDYSSAGMIWDYFFKTGVIDERLYDYVNFSLIAGVDAHDNGKINLQKGQCTFSIVISNFAPIHYEAAEVEKEAAFFMALDFAIGHLERLIKRYHYTLSFREVVAQKMTECAGSGSKVMVFDRAIPWNDLFFELGGENHPAEFVVIPSGNQWNLRGIPPSTARRMQVRVLQPEAWAGLREGELASVSGIKGGVFCHKGRFISIWETKEAALQACEAITGEKVL